MSKISARRREQARDILKNLSRQSENVRAYLLTQPLGRDIEAETRNTILSTIKIKTDQDVELEQLRKSHQTTREANRPRMLHHFDKQHIDFVEAKAHLLSPKVRKQIAYPGQKLKRINHADKLTATKLAALNAEGIYSPRMLL